MKIIKLLLAPNKFSAIIAVLWTVIIIVLSFKDASSYPKITIPHFDKLVHFTFYFGFVFFWLQAFCFYKKEQTKLYYILIIAIVLGIVIEIGQGCLTSNRHSDFLDIIANTLGALAGFVWFKKILKIIKKS